MRVHRAIQGWALLVFISSRGSAQQMHVPTPSTWSLNAVASDLSGAPAPRSDVQKVLKDTDTWLSIDETVVTADGTKLQLVWSGPTDGKMHPASKPAGAMTSWNGPQNKGLTKMPDGTSYDMKILRVTPKQVTFQQTRHDPDGHVLRQKLV